MNHEMQARLDKSVDNLLISLNEYERKNRIERDNANNPTN